MSNPPWHILGFGVIGQLLHAGFCRSGQPSEVIPKTHKPLPASHTVHYQDRIETFEIKASNSAAGPIKRLIVCTKSYDVIDAVNAIKHSLSPKAQIIIMVNGIVDSDEIAKLTSGSLYWALTTEGGYRTEAYTTVHGGSGMTRLGSGPAPDWLSGWQRAVPNSHWHNDIEPFRWEKLCVNAVINPMTALHHCRNGELANEDFKASTQTAINEAGAILNALGFKEQADRFHHTCWEVIRKTGANRSSMLQDVSANRRTELSTILPPLLSAAARQNIPTPQLEKTLRAFTQRFPDLY